MLGAESQRKQILADLERRLARTEAKSEQYERKHEAATATVSALKQGVHSVFDKLGCDSALNLELLGSEGVTEANLMQYVVLSTPNPNPNPPRRGRVHATQHANPNPNPTRQP